MSPGFEWRISTAATFDRREYLWDYSLSGFVRCFPYRWAFVRTRSAPVPLALNFVTPI